jgi:hypothetical protein
MQDLTPTPVVLPALLATQHVGVISPKSCCRTNGTLTPMTRPGIVVMQDLTPTLWQCSRAFANPTWPRPLGRGNRQANPV